MLRHCVLLLPGWRVSTNHLTPWCSKPLCWKRACAISGDFTRIKPLTTVLSESWKFHASKIAACAAACWCTHQALAASHGLLTIWCKFVQYFWSITILRTTVPAFLFCRSTVKGVDGLLCIRPPMWQSHPALTWSLDPMWPASLCHFAFASQGCESMSSLAWGRPVTKILAFTLSLEVRMSCASCACSMSSAWRTMFHSVQSDWSKKFDSSWLQMQSFTFSDGPNSCSRGRHRAVCHSSTTLWWNFLDLFHLFWLILAWATLECWTHLCLCCVWDDLAAFQRAWVLCFAESTFQVSAWRRIFLIPCMSALPPLDEVKRCWSSPRNQKSISSSECSCVFCIKVGSACKRPPLAPPPRRR